MFDLGTVLVLVPFIIKAVADVAMLNVVPPITKIPPPAVIGRP